MGAGATGGTTRRGRLRIGIAVVRGASMEPTLRGGDRLLVLHGLAPRVGDVVAARFADGTDVVKRIAERRADRWWLLSDAPDVGVDSRHRGAVPDADVRAVVLARLWPGPRWLRRRRGGL